MSQTAWFFCKNRQSTIYLRPGWAVSGLSLRPIDRITQTAQAIGEERDFTRRVAYIRQDSLSCNLGKRTWREYHAERKWTEVGKDVVRVVLYIGRSDAFQQVAGGPDGGDQPKITSRPVCIGIMFYRPSSNLILFNIHRIQSAQQTQKLDILARLGF